MQLFFQPVAASWMKLSGGSWLVTFVWVKHPISPLDCARSFWLHSSWLSMMQKGNPLGIHPFCCWRQGICTLGLSIKHWRCEWGSLFSMGVLHIVKRSSVFGLLPFWQPKYQIVLKYGLLPFMTESFWDVFGQKSTWKNTTCTAKCILGWNDLLSRDGAVNVYGLVVFHMKQQILIVTREGYLWFLQVKPAVFLP